jgi:sterol desaturase/sphingolipid hydroxylase (fatty acid hydroxylase superfamily)
MLSMESEPYIRLGFFFGIFAVMTAWEIMAPKRALTTSKAVRWFSNLTLTFFNSFVLRMFFPVLAIGTAYWCKDYGCGLLNLFGIPNFIAGLIAIVILDMMIYLQHVAFHIIPHFWKLHMMHHADLDIDVTTGARFHPIEIVLSMLIKLGVVIIIGAPPWSVLAFEVLLNGTAMFNHSNVDLPVGIDRILRLFVVTPDMHRVHHSVIIKETNSNYGFNFPWWDRLFKTYIDQPDKGHIDMKIGLANFRDPKQTTLPNMLVLPFQDKER